MDLVSAIITTHKREPEIIDRALQSVLAQTYSNMEIIVVDDSPGDFIHRAAVKQIVEEAGAVYIAHENCRGACAARNTGLSACQGKFVGFLDDDDEWWPQKIEKQISLMEDKDVALVYCGNEILRESTGERTISNRKFSKGYIYEELIFENFIGSTSFPLLRKTAVLDAGGFDPQMESAQDFDLWIRVAKEHKVDYIKDPLVTYHFHEGEQITKNPNKKLAGLNRINEKNKEYLDQHPNAWWVRYSKVIPFYVRLGQTKKALNLWWKCVKKCPNKIWGNINNLISLIKVYLVSKRKLS